MKCLRPCLLLVIVACMSVPLAQSQTAFQPTPILLVENALIFTMAPETRDAAHRAPQLGYLLVGKDGRLLAVASGAPPATLHAQQIFDARGHWVLPGFLSAHSHLWQSAFRGLAAESTLTGWLTAVYDDSANKAQPEDFYWFMLDGALDHLQHGITAAYSFNYGGYKAPAPGGDVATSYNGYAFRAEMDSGLRFVHGYDVGWATAPGVTPVYSAAQARVPLKAFLDWASAQRTQQDRNRYLSTMVSGYTAFAQTEQQAVMDKALMDEFHLGNQSHYLEPPDTMKAEQAKFAWFQDTGLLGPQLIFGHFIHTTPAIVAAAVRAGASMSWNPLSNGRLASGVADIPAYLKAGLRVGMGVDGEASADLADPFENMRTGLYAIRDKYEDATILGPYDVLRLHTMGSADVLGVADRLGSLEPGKLADFLVVDPARFGPVSDAYASLVFIAGERDIERVYVGGVLKVRNGVLLGQDTHEVKTEIAKRVAKLRAAPAVGVKSY